MTTPRLSLNQPVATDNVDVLTALRHQLQRIDDVFDALPCTSTTRPTNLLFVGQLIYETDTGNLMYWDTVWKLFCNGQNPLGRLAFVSSTAAGSTVSGTQEAGPYLSLSFNVRKNRQYAFHWSVTLDNQTGNNTPSRWINIREAFGGTVDQSSPLAGRIVADVDDNSTGLSVRQMGGGSLFPNTDSVVTLGLFLQATSGTNQTLINSGSFHTLSVEDIGYRAS